MELLKTPTASLSIGNAGQPPSKRRAGGHGPTLADEVEWFSGPWTAEDGRDYGPAVTRWTRITGHRPPWPVALAPRGGMRLNPRFVEWMMGHVPGWITDVPGLKRTDMFKVIGGGVVQLQAEAAFQELLDDTRDEL